MATIQGIYIALFGRPADPAGLAFFNAETNNGADLTAIGDLAATDEYQDRFTGLSNAEIINSIYQSLFGRDGEQEGIDFFVAALEDGTYNINNIAIAILDGAQGDDLATVNAKIAAANIFTAALDQDFEVDAYSGPDAAALARDFIDTVTINDAGTQEEADAVIATIVNQGGNEPPAPGGGEGGNFAPVAEGEAYSVNEDGVLNGASVLGNDVDAEGSLLTAVLEQDVSNGSLTLNADGTFTYTPDANFVGTDSFTYRANDGAANSNEVTVTIDVINQPDTYFLNPTGSDFTIQNWHPDDLIQINRTGHSENGASIEYAEAAGTFADLAAAKAALQDLTDLPTGIFWGVTFYTGDNDVVAAQYDNGLGGTNVLVGIDNERDGFGNDRFIIVENVGLSDIDASNFNLI